MSSSEIMKDSIPMLLSHLGMDVVAGVSKFSDLSRQKFHTLHGVAENDTLINLKLSNRTNTERKYQHAKK
jgi:hypothetical protein